MGAIEREIAPSDADVVASSPIITYKISVITGDRRGARTDANVFITIFGTGGDSGECKLESSGNNFKRNQTDHFGIDCIDIGDLQCISIGHDNTGFGASWFLDKIIITNQKSQERSYFLSGEWFEGPNNRKEITASDTDGNCYQPLVPYQIEVTTGDSKGTGTDANVYIFLFGFWRVCLMGLEIFLNTTKKEKERKINQM